MKQREDENGLVARIGRYFKSAQVQSLGLGIGDDAALFQPLRGRQTILTCDWFLEGSHFLRDKHPAEAVGWKCLARAVSDIAAMGGEPRCFLLSLALPDQLTQKWLDEFLRGLKRASTALRCVLAGGDTARHDKVLINIAVIGEVQKGHAALRSGARPGDLLFVSGRLGEAEFGLRQLRNQRGLARATNAAIRKHLYPEPHLALGRWLARNRLASAMIDVSDGLSSDLARLCEASGVGAVIAESAVPGPEGLPEAEARRLALHGGDDYELLFTVHPSQVRRLRKSLTRKSHRGLPISLVGAITKKRKVLLVKDEGVAEVLSPGGWDPFRGR
jgi:thiamine-monophosphate kinase